MKLAELIKEAGMTQSDFASKVASLALFLQENEIPDWLVASVIGARGADRNEIKALVTIMLVAQSERIVADKVTTTAYKASLN